MEARRRTRGVPLGSSLLAGMASGCVAAVLALAELPLLHAAAPGPTPTMGSALAGGVLCGADYWLWGRLMRRPGVGLWVTGILAATLISACELLLPPVAGGAGRWLAVSGIVVPARQIGALLGMASFSHGRFPAPFLRATLPMNYMPVVVSGLLLPWWAPPRIAARRVPSTTRRSRRALAR